MKSNEWNEVFMKVTATCVCACFPFTPHLVHLIRYLDGLFMVTECTARLHCSCVSSGKNLEGAYGFTHE